MEEIRNTTYDQVSNAFYELTEEYGIYPVSVTMVQERLNTTFYQARKYMNQLRDSGIIEYIEVTLTPEEKARYDYKLNFPVKGFRYTIDNPDEVYEDKFCVITNKKLIGKVFQGRGTEDLYDYETILGFDAEFSEPYNAYMLRLDGSFSIFDEVEVLTNGKVIK